MRFAFPRGMPFVDRVFLWQFLKIVARFEIFDFSLSMPLPLRMNRLLGLALLITSTDTRSFTLDANAAILYNTQTTPSGCVRVSNASISIDMTTAACNGFQCPRCFVYPTANTLSVTLTLTNCHATTVYPQNTAAPYPLDINQVIEYTFLFLDPGSARTWTINDGDSSFTLTNTARHKTVLCYNGNLYRE